MKGVDRIDSVARSMATGLVTDQGLLVTLPRPATHRRLVKSGDKEVNPVDSRILGKQVVLVGVRCQQRTVTASS